MNKKFFQQHLSYKVQIFFLLFLLPACLLAQKQPNTINWQLDSTIKGVSFYHTLVECNGRLVVLLKLNNTNPGKVEVSWKEVFTTQQGPKIQGYLGKKTLMLITGERMETDCINPSTKELIVRPEQVQPTYVADISRFDYQSIQVTEIK